MRELPGRFSQRVTDAAPLFPAAAGLAVGVAFDNAWRFGLVGYVVTFVVVCVLAGVRGVRWNLGALLVLVAAASVGAALHLASVRRSPETSVERLVGEDELLARVRGTIVSQPRMLEPQASYPFARWSIGGERTTFLFQVEQYEGADGDVAAGGLLRVTISEAILDLRQGERVELCGWLYRFRPPGNWASYDWARFYRRQGIVAGLRCGLRENVRRLAPAATVRAGTATRARNALRALLTSDFGAGSEESASLLQAMILGHRSGLDKRLNDVFIEAGCIHFLAVSGVHVVIVLFLVRLAWRPFARTPDSATWVMLAAVFAYVIIAEPRPSILRAGVMSALYCIARLMGRQRAYLNWISAAAVILIVIDPATVFDAGFQLSFAAVLGVSYLTPALRGMAQTSWAAARKALPRVPSPADQLGPVAAAPGDGPLPIELVHKTWCAVKVNASTAAVVSLGAWVAALPIIAAHFQRIQPWGAVNSCLVFPLVAVVMALGFAKLVAGAISPALGSALAGPLHAADSFLIWSVEKLALLPGVSLDVRPPSWILVVTYYTVVLAIVLRFAVRPVFYAEASPEPAVEHEMPSRRWQNRVVIAALALMMLVGTAWHRNAAPGDALAVTVLSVGAGLATVIELPNGETVLYDAGSSGVYDVGVITLAPFLKDRGIRAIEAVYLSHPNLDHYGGVPSLADEFRVRRVVINDHFEENCAPRGPGRHLLKLLDERGVPVETLGASTANWTIGGVTFEQLWPVAKPGEALSSNDTSTVLRLTYAGRSVLLTGDIAERAQSALIERGGLAADVLLLPHHGSMRPNPADFIRAVGASALISSSNKRSRELEGGLRSAVAGTRFYNTADVGAVKVVLDANGVNVTSKRPGAGD